MDYKLASFVTIKIFARTELPVGKDGLLLGFVTIKIFARTELGEGECARMNCFVSKRQIGPILK